MKREKFDCMALINKYEKYKCPMCGDGCPGGYCRRCGEWFDASQEAAADHAAYQNEESR